MNDIKKIPGLSPQKDRTFALTIECPNGVMTHDMTKALGQISEDRDIVIHITTAQKIMLLNLDMEKGERAIEIMEKAGANIRKSRDLGHPRLCVGKPFCKFAAQDTFALGDYLYEHLARHEVKPKLKVAISGCPACCSWANMIDLGFVGVTSGYKVMIGGHGGSKPVPGTEICTIDSHESAAQILEKLTVMFNENVKRKMRVERLINKIGIETVRDHILDGVAIKK
jgi:dissimilatory sulfite reductase (desulfoviridin) alpha/beta subunit